MVDYRKRRNAQFTESGKRDSSSKGRGSSDHYRHSSLSGQIEDYATQTDEEIDATISAMMERQLMEMYEQGRIYPRKAIEQLFASLQDTNQKLQARIAELKEEIHRLQIRTEAGCLYKKIDHDTRVAVCLAFHLGEAFGGLRRYHHHLTRTYRSFRAIRSFLHCGKDSSCHCFIEALAFWLFEAAIKTTRVCPPLRSFVIKEVITSVVPAKTHSYPEQNTSDDLVLQIEVL